MSSENGTPPPHLRTSSPRADDLSSHILPDGKSPRATREDRTNSHFASHFARAEREASRAASDVSAPRTEASARAETAYRDWNAVAPSQRPLAVARASVASEFDARLHAHWVNGNDAMSNVVLAERYMGINERTVRQWRDGEKAIPLAALLVLPPTVAGELVEWVQDRRALSSHRRALPMLSDALERLDNPVAAEDRDEVLRGLAEAQRRLSDRILRLATEGK